MIKTKEINTILRDCLFKEDEIKDGVPMFEQVIVRGITLDVGFNKIRVEKHRSRIIEILKELPKTFEDGWSFLNLCIDKNDNQWGEHRNCEELMMLGMAIDKIKYCMPKDYWNMLPGGMPYIIITLGEDK